MSTESGESLPGRRADLGYEPPRVERVLSPEDLEHEVLYAGITIITDS